MIKKEYIQPEIKAVKINLPNILADSITNDTTGYKFGGDDEISDVDPIDAGDGL